MEGQKFERRNDLGIKFGWFISTTIIALLLGMFFNHTYGLAKSAQDLSFQNKTDIAVVKECVSAIKENLVSINRKMDAVVTYMNKNSKNE
jgi:hypothetical protein